jgi:hypothetical protein
MASFANSQRMKVRTAQLYAPAGLLLLAVGLLFGALWAWRKEPPTATAESDVIDVREQPAREREPAGV